MIDYMIREMTRADVGAVVAACEWLFEPPASTPPLWDAGAAAKRLQSLCASNGHQATTRDEL